MLVQDLRVSVMCVLVCQQSIYFQAHTQHKYIVVVE